MQGTEAYLGIAADVHRGLTTNASGLAVTLALSCSHAFDTLSLDTDAHIQPYARTHTHTTALRSSKLPRTILVARLFRTLVSRCGLPHSGCRKPGVPHTTMRVHQCKRCRVRSTCFQIAHKSYGFIKQFILQEACWIRYFQII